MKQGDIISPLLFNSGLEQALRSWKSRLAGHGIMIGGSERLTNIRYADDLMLFAKSLAEMIQMVQMIEEELAAAGLHLNVSKTKLLTTDSNERVPQHVEIGNAWVEVLTGGDTHKYLGRKLSGDVTQRSAVDFAARIQAAWGRFHQHQTVLLNKDVSIALRLKMFDAVVTPAVLFGSVTLPLTQRQLFRLDSTQRRMLRSIIGWPRNSAEDWRANMRRMNEKLETTMELHPMQLWTDRLYLRQFRLATSFASKTNKWPMLAASWSPLDDWKLNFVTKPRRRRGRPSCRWDDRLSNFAECRLKSSWPEAAKRRQQWVAEEQSFLNFCRSQ